MMRDSMGMRRIAGKNPGDIKRYQHGYFISRISFFFILNDSAGDPAHTQRISESHIHSSSNNSGRR